MRTSATFGRGRGRWCASADAGSNCGFGDSRRVFDSLLAPDVRSARALRWCVGRAYALRWQGGAERPLLINTGHSGLDDPDYGRRSARRGCKPLFFLHDLIPITHPEYCRAGESERHRRRLATMLSAGKGLVVNSQVTREALESFAAQERLATPPCAVVPLAPASLPPASLASPLGKPYFVILGTIEPRRIICCCCTCFGGFLCSSSVQRRRACSSLASADGNARMSSTCWNAASPCGALSANIHAADAELATSSSSPRAVVPSFEEGYGMPLVEALAVGVPVLASTLPVFREIADDIPEYIDPLDGNAWHRMILDYAAADSALRNAQLRRMTGYRPPTWPDHFAKVEELIERIDAAGS